MARPPSLRIYVPDAPPAGTDPVLAAWLTGELYRISQIAALGADTGDGQDDVIVGHTHNGTDSALVPHNNTSDRDVLDCHPQNSITGLVAGQTAQDDALSAHTTDDALHVPQDGTPGQVLGRVSGTDVRQWVDPDVNSIGEIISGTGDVWTDVNAYCFAGPDSDGSCRMCIADNSIAYVGHDGVVYRYFGPTPVCVGSGGAGGAFPWRETLEADWLPTGTTAHPSLSSRDAADSHPQSAITDLVADQGTQDTRLTDVESRADETDTEQGAQDTRLDTLETRADETDTEQTAQDTLIADHAHTGSDGSSSVTHTSLSGRYTANQHRIANITDLQDELDQIEADQQVQNTELARLEQDKLNTADALVVFSFAAYANLVSPDNSAFPDIGAAWQKLDILTAITGVVTHRGITVDRPNSSFTFDYDGVYRISVTGSFEHNSSNSGRITYVRIYNETTASGEDGLVLGTGRNAEATTISASFLAEVGEAQKGDVFSFQIGNGDDYTAVNFQTLGVSINAVSESREPITGAGG